MRSGLSAAAVDFTQMTSDSSHKRLLPKIPASTEVDRETHYCWRRKNGWWLCKRYQEGFVFALFFFFFSPSACHRVNRSIQFASSSKENLFHLDCTDSLIWPFIKTINDMSLFFPLQEQMRAVRFGLPFPLQERGDHSKIGDSWQIRHTLGDRSQRQGNCQQVATAERGRRADAKAGETECGQTGCGGWRWTRSSPNKTPRLSLLSHAE